MTIPEYAKKNFQPDPNDDEKTALLKKYYIEKDKTDREILGKEQEQKEISNVEKMKKELNKMKGKTPIEQLEREYYINELINSL